MPYYGTSSAPEALQAMFDGLERTIAYIDDILVYGRNVAEHNTRFKVVLEGAKMFNFRFNKAKLQLAKDKIKFLGHTIATEGISVDIKKSQMLVTWGKLE